MSNEIECMVIETLPGGSGAVAIYRAPLKRDDTLAGLQDAVGGLVECIDIRHPFTGDIATIWIHEEGKAMDLPRNDMAMIVAVAGGWEGLQWNDWIAGSVAVTGFDPESGETTALPDEWATLIGRLA